ncbi:nuclear transport factor 2 family protein [Shewanella sp. VB17]|uniref:nuclear transport factor 2 family protein n=1 Tax=Shewanella sp. VB17 TaxID=2739432 RepID=UPI001C27CD3E|nr:nuclear transport factor 2 family protein [Shewanella sp. VB17]
MNNQEANTMSNQETLAFLNTFSQAWNDHDIDALMNCMTTDCEFHAIAGADLLGASFYGFDDVKTAFQLAWKNFPDAQWLDGDHFISGDRAVTESTFCGTKADGTRVEARMVDIFTLRDGKIQVKNAFRKDRPSLTVSA